MSGQQGHIRCDDFALTLEHIQLIGLYNQAVSMVAGLERCLGAGVSRDRRKESQSKLNSAPRKKSYALTI